MSPTLVRLRIRRLDGRFAVSRLSPASPAPDWAAGSCFTSITRTADELSVVCPERLVPAGVMTEPGWRCLQVVGPIPFTQVGVLAALVAPLAEAGIPVFAVSTFDTDYLLLRADHLDRAQAVLRNAGHEILE
jgi:hypothetical protein